MQLQSQMLGNTATAALSVGAVCFDKHSQEVLSAVACNGSLGHMLRQWRMCAELADQAEQRRQTAITAERRPDCVHLCGVDLMSTADCLHFFADYGPVSVEWLNDTSCECPQVYLQLFLGVVRAQHKSHSVICCCQCVLDPHPCPQAKVQVLLL